MSKIKPGDKFNNLTVLYRVGTTERREIIWLCKCICGNDTRCITNELKVGHKKSCGCLRIETIKGLRTTHGLSGTDEYNTWCEIIRRTENIKSKSFNDYGGRGINMYSKWRTSFSEFLKDMGKKPSKKHSIDRIDNNKGYYPGNCRWTTLKVQSNNKRNNVLIEFEGNVLNLQQWSEKLNVTRSKAITIIKNNKNYKVLCQK